jgi:hypothetical protein
LFSFASILGLFADNYFEGAFADTLRPLIAATGIVLIVYVFNSLLLRNRKKAAILTLIVVIFLFAYGPVRDVVPLTVLRTGIYVPAWFAAGICVYLYGLIRLRKTAARLDFPTQVLTWIGIAIVAAPLAMTAYLAVISPDVAKAAKGTSRPADGAAGAEIKTLDLPGLRSLGGLSANTGLLCGRRGRFELRLDAPVLGRDVESHLPGRIHSPIGQGLKFQGRLRVSDTVLSFAHCQLGGATFSRIPWISGIWE